MGALLDLSAAILAGEAEIEDHHPFSPTNELEEVAPGVAMVSSFANVAAVDTGAGLCLLDTGSVFVAGPVHDAIGAWSDGAGDHRRLHARPHRPLHGHPRLRGRRPGAR